MIKVYEKLDKLLESEENKWYCKTCDVRCFTKEYYDDHIKERKHKDKIQNRKRPMEEESEGKKNISKPNTTRKTQRKDKVRNPDKTKQKPTPHKKDKVRNPDKTKQPPKVDDNKTKDS